MTLPVEWEVRAANPPPAFSYLAGPAGCNQAPGYPDPPLCTPLPLPGILGAPQAGASYVDPNFGGRVRVITAAPIYHTYSTPSPLSAHQKYLMSYLENGTWEIVDVATARVAVPAQSVQSELLLGCHGRRGILLLSGRRGFQT